MSVPGVGEWLTVQTVVDDPTYLPKPFVTSTNSKKGSDGSGVEAATLQLTSAKSHRSVLRLG